MKIDRNIYRILIVEDNPGDYLLVSDYLSEHIQNPVLTHVKTFMESQALLEKNTVEFDLLLLDLSLPDVAKNNLIELAGKITKQLPVIILTGYADMDFAAKSLSLGVSDYLVKDIITPFVLYKSIIYSLERHRFLQSLRTSEKRYMDIFHLSPSPMWVYDMETLAFLDVNEAAMIHYGYKKHEFLSMKRSDLLVPEDIPIMEESIGNVKKHISFHTKKIFRHVKKSGDVIDVEVCSSLIKFKGIWGEIVLATDITEKLIQLRAIEEQNKKLREIAWTQSHIVRAPVARLMGLVNLIKSEELIGTEKDEILEHVYASAEEIDLIIKEIVVKSQEFIQT